MTTGSIFWFVFFAAFGGAIVLAGLLLEQFSERKWHKNLTDFRRCKSIKCWGEWLVIAGVLVETVVAVLSAIDEWQTRQMEIKDAPMNQPISEINAVAIINLEPVNINPMTPASLENTYLDLMGTNIYNYSANFGQPFHLVPRTFPREFDHRPFGQNKAFKSFAIELEQYPVPLFEYENWTNFVKPPKPTVREALAEVHTTQIYVDFIPKNARIIGGHVYLKVNGFAKEFMIPEQNTDTNYSTWNPNAAGVFIFATNAIP